MDVERELERLKDIKDEQAEDTCSNQWCDNPAPITYYEDDYADGFPVCRDCLEILNA